MAFLQQGKCMGWQSIFIREKLCTFAAQAARPSLVQRPMKKNLNIQGLRGVCALMVFAGHAFGVYTLPWLVALSDTPLYLPWDGHAAVMMFFALSGYLYYTRQPLSLGGYLRKIRRRVLRLLPPYWLSIGVGAVLCNVFLAYGWGGGGGESPWFSQFWTEAVTLPRFLREASVLAMQNVPSDTYINPNAWYLIVDLKMMLVMPLLVFGLNKTRWWLCFPLLFALLVSGKGLYLAVYLAGAALHHGQDAVRRTLQRSRLVSWVVLVVGLSLWDFPHWADASRIGIYSDVVQSAGALLLLSLVVTLPGSSWLSHRAWVSLGNLSYEFYILHFLVLATLQPLVGSAFPFVVLSFLLSLVVARLAHHVMERMG